MNSKTTQQLTPEINIISKDEGGCSQSLLFKNSSPGVFNAVTLNLTTKKIVNFRQNGRIIITTRITSIFPPTKEENNIQTEISSNKQKMQQQPPIPTLNANEGKEKCLQSIENYRENSQLDEKENRSPLQNKIPFKKSKKFYHVLNIIKEKQSPLTKKVNTTKEKEKHHPSTCIQKIKQDTTDKSDCGTHDTVLKSAADDGFEKNFKKFSEDHENSGYVSSFTMESPDSGHFPSDESDINDSFEDLKKDEKSNNKDRTDSKNALLEALGLQSPSAQKLLITKRPKLVIPEKLANQKNVTNSRKRRVRTKNQKTLLTDFFKKSRIPFTDGIGLHLVKEYDDRQQQVLNNEMSCSTISNSEHENNQADIRIITKRKNIKDDDTCHKYCFSKKQRARKQVEAIVGINSNSFENFNKCRTLTIKIKRISPAEIRQRTRRQWKFLSNIKPFLPVVKVEPFVKKKRIQIRHFD